MNGDDRTNRNEERTLERPTGQGEELRAEDLIGRLSSSVSAASTRSLGEPLSIHEVATLLGCSAWTVRQRYLPQGLPHLRACAGGRIVFFREQVLTWILKRQQQKGGTRK